jgi:hypothetical protein
MKPHTVVILQPSYLPWLGYFEQFYQCDVFVAYDDVQYTKNDWRNRNRIRNTQGWQWLTVPVATSGRPEQTLQEVQIVQNTPWARKHLAALRASYGKAPFFELYYPPLEALYEQEWHYLTDLNLSLFQTLAGFLGLTRTLVRSSGLGIQGEPTERLVKICQHFGAERFYEGSAGRNYLQVEAFEAQGIQVQYQDYPHPEYQQLHGPFEAYMSCIDLLFNHGPASLGILIGQTPP